MLTFAVLVWFVMRFLWEPMTKMLEARKKTIADGLAAAERGRHELKLAEQGAKKQLSEAKQQAAEIIAQAHKRADEMVEEAKLKGKEEGQRQLEVAQAEIDQEANRAKEHLREQYVNLVVSGVEKILERELSAQSHADYIEKLADKL